jgi:copper transport protein
MATSALLCLGIVIAAVGASLWDLATAGHAHAEARMGAVHAAGLVDSPGLLSWGSTYALARWITYSAVLLSAGGALFLIAIHDRRPGERRPLTGVMTGAAILGALGSLSVLVLQAADVTGLGGAVIREPATLLALLQSPDGTGAIVRISGLTLMLAAIPAVPAGRGDTALLGGGCLAVLSFALAGHAVSAEPRWLAVLSDACHSLAAAMWFGGLVLLAIVLHRRRHVSDAMPGAMMIARFSAWATGALLMVVLAGLALAWVEVRTLHALVAGPYGWTLTVKALIVVAVMAVGAYNNRFLVPSIKGGERGMAWRRLRWTVRVEAIGLLVVIAATAVLVDQAPPRPHVHSPLIPPATGDVGDAGPSAAP